MNSPIRRKPLISVLSPVYGCMPCLGELVAQVREALDKAGLEWELILVDDRGPDEPWSLISELARADHRVRGIRLARNHGQHLAIWAGLEAARGEWTAVLDCDLQDDPAVIPCLLEIAQEGNVDAVIVERGRWRDNAFRRLAAQMFFRMVRALGGMRIENTGNFGLYSRRMVDVLLRFGEQEVFLPMMVGLTGLKTHKFPCDRAQRAAGRSAYSLLALMRLSAAVIIRFSDRPLKISVFVGFAFSILSVLVSVVLVIAWLQGLFTVPGWTSTMLSLWFLSGLIMATLGIQGFYLGRVFSEVKARPRILVEETTFARSTQATPGHAAPEHAVSEPAVLEDHASPAAP